MLRERVLDQVLDRAAERPGAIRLVVAELDDVLLGRHRDLERHPLRLELVPDPLEHEVDDLRDLLDRQAPEHHRCVDPVEELGAEVRLQLRLDLLLHQVVGGRGAGLDRVALDTEPEAGVGLDLRGTQIRGHDDDRVAEVHAAPLGVREVPVLEDLEEDVEHLRVGLLDLVEEDHRVALATDGLRQLATLVEPHVAWRRTDEAAHVVALHELAHVDLDERVLGAEHELCERLGELGLADPGGPEEDEGADRALRVLEAGPGAPDGAGDGLDRLLLADEPRVEDLLHLEQALRLLLRDARHGDAGPHRHDLGDLLLVDLGSLTGDARLPLGAQVIHVLPGGGLGLAQRGGLLVFLGVDRGVLLLGDLVQLLLRGAELRRRGGVAQSNAAGRLVDQVDRLVREMTVGDVADRQVRGCLDRVVGDPDLVVLLVALPDPDQDLDGLLERGLLNHDRLEPPLERRVLLDVLAVLVERGRPDALQLAARQRRLQDVGGVDRALGRACTHERVQLVDEQDRVVGVAELLDDLLEPLLELAAVLGAGDEGADVQGQDPLVEQDVRDVARDDAVRQALGDGRLAHARLADQRRVVLRLPAEDLDDPLDLLLAADHRVELVGAGRLREVDAECVDGRRLAGALGLLGRAGRGGLRQDADDLVADLVQVDAQALEHTGGDALALADEPEQQVLRPDVVVTEPARFVDRQLDDALCARRQADLADDRPIATPDDELDGRPDLGQLDVHVLEHARGHALALAHEPEEQVLRPDVVVVEPLRLVLSECQDLARAIRELVESIHPAGSSSWSRWRPAGHPSTQP